MVVPERPEVTLVGATGPLPAPDLLARGDEDGPPGRAWPLLASIAVVVLLAGLGAVRTDTTGAPDEAAGEVAGELRLEADSVTVTQGGVLVVPVELGNLGPSFEVRRASVFAEPVRLDPEVQAPPSVDALEARRLVVLVAPDCRLLRSQSGLGFAASLLVRIGVGSVGRDLVLDIGQDPEIRQRVAGLCGPPGMPGVPFPPT